VRRRLQLEKDLGSHGDFLVKDKQLSGRNFMQRAPGRSKAVENVGHHTFLRLSLGDPVTFSLGLDVFFPFWVRTSSSSFWFCFLNCHSYLICVFLRVWVLLIASPKCVFNMFVPPYLLRIISWIRKVLH
jgi:hypothetical protein